MEVNEELIEFIINSESKPEIEFNSQQNAVLEEFEKGKVPLVVTARAGGGKTSVNVAGIPRAPVKKKCYVAFNTRNANEAKTKLPPDIRSTTLNGLSYGICMSKWKNITPDNAVDSDRIKEVVKNKSEFSKHTKIPFGTINQIISYAKNTWARAGIEELKILASARNFHVDNSFLNDGWTDEAACKVAYYAMELAKKTRDKQNRISFDDQIWLPIVNNWTWPIYDILVVDEAQDLNNTQYELANRVCKGRLILVGDRRQAIYDFRGSNVEIMDTHLAKEGAKELPLTVSFRCAKSIVRLVANMVPDFEAAPNAVEGTVDQILSENLVNSVKAGDVVLSRTNAPLLPACLELIRKGIPAFVQGKDIGKNLKNIIDLIGANSIKQLLDELENYRSERIARITGDPDEVSKQVDKIVDDIETIKAIAEDCEDIYSISLKIDKLFQNIEDSSQKVCFSSVHKAKGMEWAHVFILYDTLRADIYSPNVSEEQNIAYVALTRAKTWLTLVSSLSNDILRKKGD